MNLVIVESPSKASTIKSYLGSNYKVIASKGHVRDLPKSALGVDIDNGFEAHYINIRGKGDLIKEIKKDAKNATKVFLATDPDREGEALSWHLAECLGIPIEATRRVTFNEITKTAVKAAIKAPAQIDMNLVNAQQARRILDRIVGYKLSPFLWKKVKSGLSAGRVQSVATRIIVDREEEISAFVPSEYWTIDVILNDNGKTFAVHFYGDSKSKIRLESQDDVNKVINAIDKDSFVVSSVKRGNKQKAPAPPFTTSTMQQEASKKLGFQSQRVMKVAQELYEGVNLGSELGGVQGLITYMRTDSLRISAEAQAAAREFIKEKFGDKFCPATPRAYKAKSGAQDAHEAIRPARIELEPAKIKKYLTSDQFKLYKLIWDRFTASQMQSAKLSTLAVDFNNNGYVFRTSGYTVTFLGYMAVYEETEEELKRNADEPIEEKDIRIPELTEGQVLSMDYIKPDQHYTEPPSRYTEASLIKFLEEKGIGRPSTYAPIITTIISREYVKRDGKVFVPTQLGIVTTKLMKESFSDIVDCKFTARMEDMLDSIEHGESTISGVLGEFWKDFEKELAEAEKNTDKAGVEMIAEETDIICEKCGSRMIVKNGRYGKFAACPNFPKCRNTKPLVSEEKKEEAHKEVMVAEGMKCEVCGSDMVIRNGKYGSFYACSQYPKCKFTKQKNKEIEAPCPVCGGKVVIKYGKAKNAFYCCENYPKCDFSSWDMPLTEKCPQCGKTLFRKKGKPLVVCRDKKCGYEKEVELEESEL